MSWKEFILKFLILFSIDGFGISLLYLLWKYIDLKYFSSFEISTLREENKYLKQENQKVNGTSTNFWSKEDMK